MTTAVIASIFIYIDSASAGQSANDVVKKDQSTKEIVSNDQKSGVSGKKTPKSDLKSKSRQLLSRKYKTRSDKSADRASSKIMSLLFIVLVLGIACWYVFKKYLPAKVNASPKCIAVIEKASLGKGKGLALVSVGGKNLLLSMTPEKVVLVSEVGEIEIPEKPAETSKSFMEVISSITAGGNKSQEKDSGDQA